MPSILESFPRPTKTYHSQTYDRISKHHNFAGHGKTVLITGGASGLGYSISAAFAAAGVSRIVILSRNPADQAQAKTSLEAAHPATQILTYPVSVTDYARVREILTQVAPIDILVLNAGVAHRRAKATEITLDEVQECFDTNVIAAFHLVRTFLSNDLQPPASGQRTVINLSSAALQTSGLRVGYGPGKAASTQMMQQFAADTKGEGVKIVSMHPGVLFTPGVARIFAGAGATGVGGVKMDWEDIRLPADFAVWLAGPESDFLNGRMVWAQWDVDELMELKERVEREKGFLTVGLIQ